MEILEQTINHIALVSPEIEEQALIDCISESIDSGASVFSVFTNLDKVKPQGIQKLLNDKQSIIRIHAFPYGRAKNRLVAEFKDLLTDKEVDIEKIDTEEFRELIYRDGQFPEPDLIVKVGEGLESFDGSVSIEASYAELFFAKVSTKEFSGMHFKAALDEYGKRKRNFGK